MSLMIEQIREVLKEPTPNKRKVSEAVQHESRIKLHTLQTVNGNYHSRSALNDYLGWVRGILPIDKYKIFLHLFRYPVKTTILTDKIFSGFTKIFKGANAVETIEFTNPDLKEDWDTFKPEKIRKIIETEGVEAFKNKINSVLVVDLTQEQTTERPDPYFYFLNIGSVWDFEIKDNTIEWIIFEQSKNKVVVICDGFYRVLKMRDGSKTEIEAVEVEQPHDLGFAPVCFFWDTPISYDEPSLKKSPITPYLGDLDWSLFFSMSKRHVDTYAPFPILAGFEEDCDYLAENGDSCENGFLKDQNGFYYPNRTSQTGETILQPCPICAKRNGLAGAGSYIEVPIPDEANGNADLRNPVSITTVPRENLDYVTEEAERLEAEIYQAVTGDLGGTINTQAINADQVFSFFEGQKQKLEPVKKNFELAMSWVTSTIAKLRYGNSFKSYSIDLGTEFYLIDENLLLQLYTNGIKEGLSSVFLDEIQDQYNKTKYRNNPEKLRRIEILNNLDPLRHKTIKQAAEMFDATLIDFKTYFLKANFSSLLMRFERENTSVLEFGNLIDFDKKINSIREILESYIVEIPRPIETNI